MGTIQVMYCHPINKYYEKTHTKIKIENYSFITWLESFLLDKEQRESKDWPEIIPLFLNSNKLIAIPYDTFEQDFISLVKRISKETTGEEFTFLLVKKDF